MTRIRRLFTKEMLTELLNQVSISKDEDIVTSPMSKVVKSSTEKMEREQRKRKNESTDEIILVKKKKDSEWNPEDNAQPNGKLIKFTSEGEEKKYHYEKFEFHGKTYGLEDSVLLTPDDTNRKPYVAIIKDIYVEGKEGCVKLIVQWFYRPEDIEKKYVGNWKSNDARDLFYSFHYDEVVAESVILGCLVHFVPKNTQIPNSKEHPGFIVQKVYNIAKKKLWKFTHDEFNEQQKYEIDFLVAKTISRIGVLPDFEKEQKTLESMGKQFAKKRFILQFEITSPESCNVVNAPDYKSILEKFDMLTGDSDRDKKLGELLEAVKHKCRLTEKKKANDYDFFWPNDVVPVVRALEQVFYQSFSKDVSKYKRKLAVLVDNLKNSGMLAERFLNGDLKPQQFITMKRYELVNGHTRDGIAAVIEEPILKIDDPSTSKKR